MLKDTTRGRSLLRAPAQLPVLIVLLLVGLAVSCAPPKAKYEARNLILAGAQPNAANATPTCLTGHTATASALALSAAVSPTASAAVTYSMTIAPMMEASCTSCHVAGKQAPDLSTFAAVTAAAQLSLLAITSNAMPPASPLAATDKANFSLWVSGGMLETAAQSTPAAASPSPAAPTPVTPEMPAASPPSATAAPVTASTADGCGSTGASAPGSTTPQTVGVSPTTSGPASDDSVATPGSDPAGTKPASPASPSSPAVSPLPTLGTKTATGTAAAAPTVNFSGDFSQLDAADTALFASLPQGSTQLATLCARQTGGMDRVTRAFCQSSPPVLTGLADVLQLLGLNLQTGSAGFALLGHSTSLAAQTTSAINPRAVFFTAPTGAPISDYVAVTFIRGAQTVEIAAALPGVTGPFALNFYLLHFNQACNGKAGGCTPLDLFTPAVEKNWLSYTLYADVDLADTVLDCDRCHQTAGPTANKFLRLQENSAPFTHWFSGATVGGKALLADFQAAHGTSEAYAGIPAALLAASAPAQLAQLLSVNGFGTQPNRFDSATVEAQVTASSPLQPTSNAVPGTSSAWAAIYNNALSGAVIPVPYHDVKVTDPAKLPAYIQAYQAFLAGASSAAKFPDLRGVFLQARAADMSFAPAAGLSAPALFKQACGSCHNAQLDQSLPRAKFNADLTQDSALEKAVAAQRLALPLTDPKRMPPPKAMVLTPDQINLMTTELGN